MTNSTTLVSRASGCAVAVALLGSLYCAGCGSDAGAPSADDKRPGGGVGVGGTGGGIAPPAPAPGCVATAGPDLPDEAGADTNCDGVDGDVARSIFVAARGNDGDPGTPDRPVASIRRGIELASPEGKAVLVAAGTYAESLVVTGTTAVAVYGGYDANGWKRAADDPVVAPPSGVPLTVRDAKGAVTFQRVGFVAQGATEPSGSSVGITVLRSGPVTFDSIGVTTGRGGDGRTPAAPAAVTTPALAGEDGVSLAPATCSKAVALEDRPAPCRGFAAGGGRLSPPTNFLMGGPGGYGDNLYGANRATYFAMHPGAPGAGAGAGVGGEAGQAGRAGNPGLAGAPGSSAGRGLGSIRPEGYVATNRGFDGERGADGAAGGGGAGGMSFCEESSCVTPYYVVGGGGGQGGEGGRGGAGAPGATPGGGSIGIVIFQSTVHVTGVIATGQGGAGGDSIAGAEGQPGGAGGRGGAGTGGIFQGVRGGLGFGGGAGGAGGRGGVGGAGGGGPSIGIYFFGPVPRVGPTTFRLGAAGAGGRVLSGPPAKAGTVRDIVDSASELE